MKMNLIDHEKKKNGNKWKSIKLKRSDKSWKCRNTDGTEAWLKKKLKNL